MKTVTRTVVLHTYSVAVQSLNERDTYLIDAENLTEAVIEAICSFNANHTEKASSVQAEGTCVDIND